jgi:glycosyltransferase involved in cell wall biosynthesis
VDISVIIPTYNRETLIGRALDSVLAQNSPPTEVIVVDDGSTDSSAALIRGKYPGVNYNYQENQGVSSARNAGIAIARCEWLALLDSDDEWLPAKLAAQSAALSRNPGYRICHTDEIWIRRNQRVNPMHKHAKSGGWIYEKCLPLCAISPSSVLIHRSVFADVGGFDEQLPACEDYDLWLRICASYPVLFVDDLLLKKYGGHVDQLSRKFWGMDRFRVRAMEKMIRTGSLEVHQHAATLRVLLYKLRILRNGARKRNNNQVMRECSQKIARYEEVALKAATP